MRDVSNCLGRCTELSVFVSLEGSLRLKFFRLFPKSIVVLKPRFLLLINGREAVWLAVLDFSLLFGNSTTLR